jgi:predicted nucleotide-binding protein
MIGHGHSRLWRDLKEYLRDTYQCEVVEFNSQSVIGISNKERLQELLDQASLAFLVATAEDEQGDGSLRARQNVIHEIGLFQGRLGFEKAIVMLEEGCEEFTNISGIGQIRFPKDNIDTSFEAIRKHLRERLNIQIK